MTSPDAGSVVGPSKGISVSLVEEGLDGSPVLVGAQSNCLLVDLLDDGLSWIREYDAATDPDTIVGFSEEYPNAVPLNSEVVLVANEWAASQQVERVNFYSAQEEQETEVPVEMKASSKKSAPPKRVSNAQVMDQLSTVLQQMKLLTARQEKLEKADAPNVPGPSVAQPSNTKVAPSVSAGLLGLQGHVSSPPPVAFSKVAQIVGPPPRVKVAPVLTNPGAPSHAIETVEETGDVNSGVVRALSQQSTAITALVAHLANSSDPLTELQGGGSTFGTTKGVQRRERMQAELAAGTSTYYLQMMQQLHRRLHPALPVPKSEAELNHLSFLNYMEKTGGYRGNRETGLIMWLLGHIIDAAAQDDLHQVKERLALLAISLEQSVVDKGDWQIAFLLSLAEDPPLAIYQDKTSIISPYGRPFANLVPSAWAAVVLAYVKELEVLTSKKGEASNKKASPSKAAETDAPPTSPKRKARYPKKPREDPPPNA